MDRPSTRSSTSRAKKRRSWCQGGNFDNGWDGFKSHLIFLIVQLLDAFLTCISRIVWPRPTYDLFVIVGVMFIETSTFSGRVVTKPLQSKHACEHCNYAASSEGSIRLLHEALGSLMRLTPFDYEKYEKYIDVCLCYVACHRHRSNCSHPSFNEGADMSSRYRNQSLLEENAQLRRNLNIHKDSSRGEAMRH